MFQRFADVGKLRGMRVTPSCCWLCCYALMLPVLIRLSYSRGLSPAFLFACNMLWGSALRDRQSCCRSRSVRCGLSFLRLLRAACVRFALGMLGYSLSGARRLRVAVCFLCDAGGAGLARFRSAIQKRLREYRGKHSFNISLRDAQAFVR